jgi:zinc D-Ala-D-Ala dipeptidase
MMYDDFDRGFSSIAHAAAIAVAFWCGAASAIAAETAATPASPNGESGNERGIDQHASEMPKDFAYLRDVDPSIQQDMRYASANNFTGGKVEGYDAPECVLVRQAAEALKAVQADIHAKGFTLKVYDCYRPARAVAAFVEWAKKPDAPDAKVAYYSNLPKSALFPDYIATRSSHSRGATMDLTLVPLAGAKAKPASQTEADKSEPCTAPQATEAPDGSVAMGTSFDCFDLKSHTIVPGLTDEERTNRALLVEAMQAHSFKNYPKEWWHFTLEPEPYPETIFDFPIQPRSLARGNERNTP